jgi:plasmid stabilization system protein ParE
MQVLWTAFALEQIQQIQNYYVDIAGTDIAEKISGDILDSVAILLNYPEAGQEEETLKSKKQRYRYLVKGNYKIIYSIHNNIININDVFDTRLNPTKLVKRNR